MDPRIVLTATGLVAFCLCLLLAAFLLAAPGRCAGPIGCRLASCC